MAEKSPKEEEDELKFDSSNFNALRVLTLGDVQVPYPNVRPLNNLAEYYSLVSGKRKKKTPKDGETLEVKQPSGPVPAPRPKNAPPPPDPTEIRISKRHQRNFLIKMEGNDCKFFVCVRLKFW